MYIPDPGFMRKLKELDKRLDCVYNRDAERFVITYDRGYGTPLSMFMIKNGDGLGEFRQPDDRDLDHLKRYDMSKTTGREYMDEIAKYMDNYQKKKRASSKAEFRDRTKDDKIQLMTALARPEAPKTGGGYFRKVEVKPKHGFTVIDKRKLSSVEQGGQQ